MLLKILIDFTREDEPPKTWVTCPICKRIDWYYTLCIEECEFCGANIRSIHNISSSLDKRLRFHTKGLKK